MIIAIDRKDSTPARGCVANEVAPRELDGESVGIAVTSHDTAVAGHVPGDRAVRHLQTASLPRDADAPAGNCAVFV